MDAESFYFDRQHSTEWFYESRRRDPLKARKIGGRSTNTLLDEQRRIHRKWLKAHRDPLNPHLRARLYGTSRMPPQNPHPHPAFPAAFDTGSFDLDDSDDSGDVE
jgi:hypothetical protein